ncbi:MAG: NosD domain-containing protein, partial [Methanomassiliicoccales archaeon]
MLYISSETILENLVIINGWNGTGTAQDPYVIENLDIDAAGYGAGIYLESVSNIVIRNCTIHGSDYVNSTVSGSGGEIVLCGVANCIIDNNDCNGSKRYGISIWESDSIVISNNDLSGGDAWGIATIFCGAISIIDNNCSGCSVGILVDHANDVTVDHNDCSKCSNGMAIQEVGGSLISYNDCSRSDYDGIGASSMRNTVISNNRFNNSANYGISMEYSNDNNTIINNYFSNNANYGLIFSNGCRDNKIYGNYIINNNGATSTYSASAIQASDGGVDFWNSTTYGNYWSDRTSPDVDDNGIVDVPYEIGNGNKDNYPLTRNNTMADLRITSHSSQIYTNAVSVTISGMAVDFFGIVSIEWSNSANGLNGECTGTESWSATIPLALGTNFITISMTDNVGENLNCSITVICDTTGPNLHITSPSSSYSNSTNISWTADDDRSGIDHFEVRMDDNAAVNIDSGTTSHAFGNVIDGIHTVNITAIDRAGNKAYDEVTFTLSTSSPQISFTPSSPVYTKESNLVVGFAMSDEVQMTSANVVVCSNGAIISSSDISGVVSGKVSATSTISLGLIEAATYDLRVTVHDAAGNSATSACTIIFDQTSPILNIVSPSSAFTNTASVQWTSSDSCSGVDHFNVGIDDLQSVSVPSTQSSFTFQSISEGVHTMNVTAIDRAGNSVSREVTFTIEVGSPELTIVAPESGSYNKTGVVHVVWTGHDDVSGIDHYVLRINDKSPMTLSATESDFTFSGLNDGRYAVNITAVDAAGNRAYCEVSFTVSTSSPRISISPGSGSYVNETELDISITLSNAIDIKTANWTLDVNGVQINGEDLDDLVNGTKQVTISLKVELSEGINTIHLTVTDVAGNSAVYKYLIHCDLMAPKLTIRTPSGGSNGNYTSVTASWNGTDPDSGISYY